jgi:hypothetical protein
MVPAFGPLAATTPDPFLNHARFSPRDV